MKIKFEPHPVFPLRVVMVIGENKVVLTLDEVEQMLYNLQDVILAQYKRK